MMRLMGAMEIFTAQQLEDIKDEVQFEWNQEAQECRKRNGQAMILFRVCFRSFVLISVTRIVIMTYFRLIWLETKQEVILDLLL